MQLLLLKFLTASKEHKLGYVTEEACKRGIHPGFETQGRRHQKSNAEVLVAPQKRTCVLQNFFEKTVELDYFEFTNKS